MIEASFEAEYKISLSDELPSLSWRKFIVLLNGMSKDSAFIQDISARNDQEQQGRRLIDNPEEAEQAVDNIFG